jgi:D-alanyl-D-alanine carboxypeptidase
VRTFRSSSIPTVTPIPTVRPTGASPNPSRSAIRFAVAGGDAVRVTAKQLGKSWHRGCPVAPSQLRAVGVRYWGFDGRHHGGVLIVNQAVVRPIQAAFSFMLHHHFPIHRVVPISAYGGGDNRSMAHDNTSAFNCRYAVSDGPKSWSEHAYGEAVDIDPLENPYQLGGRVLPPTGTRYVDRSNPRAGMILASGPVVDAFDRLGWGWGGRWSNSPDFQHFSVNGR